jgi:hypothetical protein
MSSDTFPLTSVVSCATHLGILWGNDKGFQRMRRETSQAEVLLMGSVLM